MIHALQLEDKFDKTQLQKLEIINNPALHEFLTYYIELLNPARLFVCTGNTTDVNYVRKKALALAEEKKLNADNHTVHFDNYYDQARDKINTKIFVSNHTKLPFLNTINRAEALDELMPLMKNIMMNKELFIGFFSLGPKNSPFMIPAVQLTDSPYVLHSELLLYREAYDVFKNNKHLHFFKFVHAEGELDERNTCKNLDKRRIYIDLDNEICFTINTQYGGNTIGLKKPAFRLTINRAVKEGWLSEHMFLMGITGPDNRVSYFTGAFPSMCGKTSTCMLPNERLVGDDLSFIKNINNEPRAVNVENGIFGIIKDINANDDPIIWDVLHSTAELIFSNILVRDGQPYWSGMGEKIPEDGENHSGIWWNGKKDTEGNLIPPSHKNARFTVNLHAFKNLDTTALDNPLGVKLSGIIFGGRDADTWPPVCESFNWTHGVVTKGAALESETTAATLGVEGIRKFNMMAILDFQSVHLGKYLKNYLEFGKRLKTYPKIFAVNYFLKDRNMKFLNEKTDKIIWLKWMELRVHDETNAISTPIGYLPKYEDLKQLFRQVLNKEYTKNDYERQFLIRTRELIAKVDRIKNIYAGIDNIPEILFTELENEKTRLLNAQQKYGAYISPFKFLNTDSN